MTYRFGDPSLVRPNSRDEWQTFGQESTTDDLADMARAIRDAAFGTRLTYSPKVFLPLTQLCRDVCHYCTFAKAPRHLRDPYMSLDEVLKVARAGAQLGCKEALFTLGERPELRYHVAAEWLQAHGYPSTIHYVAAIAEAVLKETGLLPHINAGTLTIEEIGLLRPVSASMGIMLESSSERLMSPGFPHHGSPDKSPAARLATLRRLGEQQCPTTTGILVGIGETEAERIESLLALLEIHEYYGHIQEVIIQNFRAKPGTRMAESPEPSLDELLRTVSLARIIFGGAISVQVPPNLNPADIPAMVNAGIDDWGGISPLTVDYVNPEAPWPHVNDLTTQMASIGRVLTQRLTIYPRYSLEPHRWLDRKLHTPVLELSDADGLGRDCDWRAGSVTLPPSDLVEAVTRIKPAPHTSALAQIVDKAARGTALSVSQIEQLFDARGADFSFVCRAADELRRDKVGDVVSYVVTRNINYTNVCTYHCKFCAFSKGKTSDSLRGASYNVSLAEIARRTTEAWERGATEVCMQGGIHPDFSAETYLAILRAAKTACPGMHVHAFSPLEIMQGARRAGLTLETFLGKLKDEGLGSLPGTAAEILDDEVRRAICPDKLSSDEWFEVIEAAHKIGLRTTATIMFGHVERPLHWARHLSRIRALQDQTAGFTEFVPLPFVASEAPIYLKGDARPGATFREAVLMHAVARIAFHGSISNIQTSWVKMGPLGIQACLQAGVNDLGGTLMNESITRAAGSIHGQEATPELMEKWILDAGRVPQQRTTFYKPASPERRAAAFGARDLLEPINEPFSRSKRKTVLSN